MQREKKSEREIINTTKQQHPLSSIYPFLQVIRLRKKLSGAADAVKGLFGVGKGNDEVVEKLEKMQARFWQCRTSPSH